MMDWPIKRTSRVQLRDLSNMMRMTRSTLVWLLFLVAAVSGRSLPEARRALLQDYSNTKEMNAPSPPKSFFDSAGVYLVGLGCTVLLVVTISVAAVLYLRRKRRMAAVSPYWRQGMSGQLGAFETTVPLLGREEVETACEDFSNIIDSSPDSVVYKGTLSNGTEIAALSLQKHSATWEPQSELSFRSNVKTLARMNHPHLVNLVGYCSQEEPWTRIFVFEYASNGTLHEALHNRDNKEGEHLTWAARMRVIVGAAYGLRYMHHELSPPVSHAGFASDAVFLTDDYAAKVSNYASTKTVEPRAETPRPTSWFSLRSVSDPSPESFSSFEFERNVQSFGVFLLQVITGRPPRDEQGASIVDWAAEYLRDPKMMWYTVDPSLKSHKYDELVALCKIVNLCLSDSERPSMAEITEMLTDVLRLSPESVAAKSPASLWAQLDLQDDSASSEVSG